MISRRLMQFILGAIWFLDGVFQLKPKMFSQEFIKQVILPTAQGQPSWISSMVNWGSHLVIGHIVIWNSLFAFVQLVIGIALMANFKVKETLIASFIWSAIVWIFGEGFGQIFTGMTLLINGFPGAVLIYGLLGAAIWPKSKSKDKISEWWQYGIRFAQVSLGILWLVGFVLHLQPQFMTKNGFSQVIAISSLANAIGNNGLVVSIIIGLIELILSIMLLFRIRLKIATLASIILSILFWWIGQSFGQVLDPLATDFNSGLLMAMLAICAYPDLWKESTKEELEHKTA